MWHELLQTLRYQGATPTDANLLAWWLNIRSTLTKEHRKGWDSAVMLVSWIVWKERNARVFSNLERTPLQLLGAIIEEGGNWIQAGASKLAEIGWPHRALPSRSTSDSWGA